MKSVLLAAFLLTPAAAQGIPFKGSPPTMAGSLWFTALDKDFYAVDGGDVFTVEQGQLVRRTADTHAMKAWTKAGTYAAPPVPIGQNVYLQQGGKLYAFDRQTLKSLWTKTTGGELLTKVREMPLLWQDGKIQRLNPVNGAPLWSIGKLDADHTPLTAKLADGVLLVSHSPAEGFMSEIYSAHDSNTGRKLWQANLRHGRLLKVKAGKALFDVRDWSNMLDTGGLFSLTELDLKTGERRDLSRSLAALPLGPEGWTVDIYSPLLDDQNALWLMLRAKNGGGFRLLKLDAAGKLTLWPLPAAWFPAADDAEVGIFAHRDSIVVATAGGVAVLRNGQLKTNALPLGAGIPTFTPLGRWLGLTAPAWGTVILDEAGRVKYQAKGAGLPALSGSYVLMPIDGRLTSFPAPR